MMHLAEKGVDDMAGTMVHLLIAEKLFSELSKRKWFYPFGNEVSLQKDYFIAGNICPDGIMARKNYKRLMKLHSHLRDGIPDGSFDKPGMVSLFEERLHVFWKTHMKDEERTPGLYLGYITHMMTDERFILQERPKFFENIAQEGLTQADRETFVRFNRETDWLDFRLLEDFPELQEAKCSLERVPSYEICGMITEEELTASRNWILQYFFYEEHEKKETKYLQYDSMLVFIREVTKEILLRLFQEGFLRMP